MATISDNTFESYTVNVKHNNLVNSNDESSIPPVEITNDIKPMEPVNYTDPIVRHDPIIKKSSIITKHQPQDQKNDEEHLLGGNEPYDLTKINAIQCPLIKINGMNIAPEQIKYMNINYREIVPSINLIIRDPNNTFKNSNTPSINNKITVVMIPEADGAYKAISLDFYITDCNTKTPNIITYIGKYYCMPLEQKIVGQIKYVMDNGESGCKSDKCNSSAQSMPNTWEYLHEIALKTGLGFASTHQCREIPDRLPRVLRNKTYLEFMTDQIKTSGIDEDSCFDVWIDLYRYIVMVNVSWVLNEDVKYNQLTIKAISGKNSTDENMFTAENKEVFRTLTNYDSLPKVTNLVFSDYAFTQKVDNNIHDTGIHVECPVMQIRGGAFSNNGNLGTMNIKNVQAQERSLDSTNSPVNFQTSKQLPVTIQVDPTNTNYQKLVRNKFFELKRARYYVLELSRPNFGLQRGTLVNVLVVTKDPVMKRKILTNSSNIIGANSSSMKEDNIKLDDPDKNEIISDETVSIPDFSKTGIYYIDGMTFEYDNTNGIRQTLYLIKKGNLTTINNMVSLPKFNPDIIL